ncbi:MAG: lipoyl(octanoyl) transferase LipB [Muribaculaceae bacterium]|nr:lipoyl(octanoyl) transferase LipB [Muribaculaceae bacterium]MDE6643350.1 lipoyl(octanoyl) transferase LipB [Muribaculaceae bacterium]
MFPKVEFIDCGIKPYREMWDMQLTLFNELLALKREKKPIEQEYVLMVEHEPVYTMGRHANPANMLISREMLQQDGIECINIERGGDITFHGPGQLVVYPIIDLQEHYVGVKQYVWMLEETVIRTLAKYGIKGERIEDATGVWIGKGTPGERKICAIGVRVSHSITMHGFALNVSTDLNYFNRINPCGFIDKGVTSIEAELHKKVDINSVKYDIQSILNALLNE